MTFQALSQRQGSWGLTRTGLARGQKVVEDGSKYLESVLL